METKRYRDYACVPTAASHPGSDDGRDDSDCGGGRHS